MDLKNIQIQSKYSLIYKNQTDVFLKSGDPLIYMKKTPIVKQSIEGIIKRRTCMEFTEVCRSDFPLNWKKYCSFDFREKAKEKGRLLLKKNVMFGFELLMKAAWGRNEIELKMNFDNPDKVYKLISFNEYMNDVILNFIDLKNKHTLWNNISYISHLDAIKITEKKWENYFQHLIIKYNVDINKKM